MFPQRKTEKSVLPLHYLRASIMKQPLIRKSFAMFFLRTPIQFNKNMLTQIFLSANNFA